MKRSVAAGIAGLVLVGSAFAGSGPAYAGLAFKSIPGGDILVVGMATQNYWHGDPSCEDLSSLVALTGTNPSYAVSIVNTSYVNAYGNFSTWLTWRGHSNSGKFAAHVTDTTTQGYDTRADLAGPVCIGTATVYIDGQVRGKAYVPQQGGWFEASANLN